MRDLWFLRFSPGGGDAPCDADCDCSCGGGTCLLHSGLCCPNDSLDAIVIENLDDDDLLEDLARAAFPPPPGPGSNVRRRPTTGRGRGKPAFLASQQRALGVGRRARPPPEHAALSAHSPWSTTSSSSLETEPPPPDVPRLAVPRKKRDRAERGRRSWSLDMPNVPAAAAAPENASGGGGGGPQRAVPRPRNRRAPRACTHCDETETPQWRAGPYGAGTLCNACGIRYRDGKLVPGYRPSSSPSFRSDMHSNRYRKAVRLGEKKAGEDRRQRYVDDMPPAPVGDARPW
ncbi:hypothetical protein BS78_04G020700 [Paspalum vaginatum]|nr:hypothetical protein BS78_04G020700 [Paspalum vaginatum]